MEKKLIIVDLDVVTIALWNKTGLQRQIAVRFIERLIKEEFYVINPFFLVELTLQWKHETLKEAIKEFYIKYSDKLISDTEFREKSIELGLNPENIIKKLESQGVKGEDSVLVVTASIFELDYLVTFNRKHLRNNRAKINEILKENGLKTIQIIGPEEI